MKRVVSFFLMFAAVMSFVGITAPQQATAATPASGDGAVAAFTLETVVARAMPAAISDARTHVCPILLAF
jgi:hypothetical protein